METNRKIRILWLFISILILLNVTTIATILVKRAQAANQNNQSSNAHKSGFLGNQHFFAYYLRFDQDQSKKLNKINDKMNGDMKAIGLQMRDLKIKMSKQISENQNDTLKLNAIYSEIIRIHGIVNGKNYEYYESIRSLCNPYQAERLTAFFSKSINLEKPLVAKKP
jgi:predicted transcriptional regulator